MSIAYAEDVRRDDEEGLFARDIDGRLLRMDKVTAADLERDVTVTIDGKEITVKKAVPATDSQGNILRDERGAVIPRTKEAKTGDCELEALARRLEVGTPRLARHKLRDRDDSSLVIAVDHGACILCDRCIRGCDDIRNNNVIGRTGKGYEARIAFD